jgi:hypothetical protein
MADFPTQLRAPRAPAVWPVGVRTGARPATDGETPAGALRVAQAATAAGWEVAVTYADADGVRGRRVRLAPDPESDRAPKTQLVETAAVIPSVAVRMLKPGRAYRVAFWNDGAFSVCWHLDRRRWHRIEAHRPADGSRRDAAPAHLVRLFVRERALAIGRP